MVRVDKTNYYLNLAEECARRGTCLRRNYGAVIVKNDEVIATGYTGAARGMPNCCDKGKCKREELGCKPGERYELCVSVHAEQNAIISAARRDMVGSTLYLVGIDVKTGEVLEKAEPCMMCRRMIINAGITDVVSRVGDTGSYVKTPVVAYQIISDEAK